MTSAFPSLLFACFISTSFGNYPGSLFSCSRAESRKARSILKEIVYPLYQFRNLPIPDQCPWNPLWDMYLTQESAKFQRSVQDWECRLCGKRFYTEDTLDLHMDNRHAADVDSSNKSSCLANLCPVLRCDVLEPDLAFGDQVFWDEALCEESRFDQLREQCQHLLNLCTSLDEKDPENELRNWLQMAVCDHLTCAKHWEVPDHRLPVPIGTRIALILTGIVGLIVYYVVVIIRISNPPNHPPASSLSSPYYFLSATDHQEHVRQSSRTTRTSRQP